MNKPTVVIVASIFSRSGYGDHARSISKALILSEKYDVKIIPTNWGSTPNTALDDKNPKHKVFLDHILTAPLTEKPDIGITISIPPEFKPFAKFNIGITAGIECTKMRPEWLESSNKMDLIITTSNFSAEVFKINKFQKVDQQKNPAGTLELEKPISVLFEGLDEEIFDKKLPIQQSINAQLKHLPDFNFLCVGHWLDGRQGHDRKDIGMLIRVFLDTFKRKSEKNRPGLILKTGLAGFSNLEYSIIKQKIEFIIDEIREDWKGPLPSIYLLRGELTQEEMNSLYNHSKVKAMVSFTHGEGYGRPMLEFTSTGKPVIASQWSGHLDFLHPEYSFLIPGKLEDVDNSAKNEWITGGQWFRCDYPSAASILLQCHSKYEHFLEKSRKHRKYTLDNFSEKKMGEKLIDIIERNTENKLSTSIQRTITLPKLTKMT